MTGDTADSGTLRDAEQDLDEALKVHRDELTTGVDSLLTDPVRCASHSKGMRQLTLSAEDANLMLQALNDLRVGAWERLGCPDFESGERPEVNEGNFICLWAFQVTELFEAHLLEGLMGGD